MHIYYVYILTNHTKTVLYTGVTNNIRRRLEEHRMAPKSTFCGKYRVRYLVYYESYQWIQEAIRREKFIKKKTREWKVRLIAERNPRWDFLDAP